MTDLQRLHELVRRLPTPSGAPVPGQSVWNPQRASAMPYRRYRTEDPRASTAGTDRQWPHRTLTTAPLWASVDLRDGNQALATPMDTERKALVFKLLIRLGFKEIEVGYPSASQADFDFVRTLVASDGVPDDVTISVFTPARRELIDRTFEAIEGAGRAMVHLCNATACLWRETVFGLSADETRKMAVTSAEHVLRRSEDLGGARVRFEYSPETFNVTEPEFVLELCDAISATWDATPDRPVTLNLPTTVETHSPNVFADQVEWMHRNLSRREGIVLSVHPHNDRGTAVASAELALLAGADRVEGTLFGNGERTGNVCLATLALNLFSQGHDPQIDLSRIDDVAEVVRFANRLPIHPRHPYVGDLVYTAFSGTHQDAVAKGLAELDRRAADDPSVAPKWQVPYLPVDPRDVGRTYESVVRINSQSGRGGIAHLLRDVAGLTPPRAMSAEFARIVQARVDDGDELTSRDLLTLFEETYGCPDAPHRLPAVARDPDPAERAEAVLAALPGASDERLAVVGLQTDASDDGTRPSAVAYARIADGGGAEAWGTGSADDTGDAAGLAVVSAATRLRAVRP